MDTNISYTQIEDDEQMMENPVLIMINAISLISCLFVFYRGLTAIREMTTAMKLIILVSLCDFVMCLSNFSALIRSDNGSCSIYGFLKNFAIWNGFFCCSLISFLSYLTLKEFGSFNIAKVFRFAIIGSVTITSLLALMPILHINGIEYIWAKGLCKTTFEDSKNKTWNFLFLLATRGLAYIVAIVTTLIAYKRAFSLTQNLPEDVREAFNISSKRLLVYPTAQLIIYTPNVFYDFVSIFMPYKYLPLLIVTALWSLGGFVNFLIYGGMLIQHKRAYSVESRNFSHSNYQNFDATSDGEWGINTKLSYDNEEDMLTMVVRNRLESKIM